MSNNQPKSPHEDIIMTVIVVGLIFGLAMLIWHYFHAELTNLLRWIRVGEMWIIDLWKGDGYGVVVPPDPEAVKAGVLAPTGPQSVEQWRQALTNAHVTQLDPGIMRAATYIAVPTLRPIFTVFLIAMAAWALLWGPNTHYRRKLNLEGLIREQAKAFPTIAPFVKFNPMSLPFRVVGQPVPAKLPLFAEALGPEEWIAYHEIRVQNNQIDVNQAYRALAEQLGPRWQGPMKLPIHAQGIYAACALRHARKRKDSEQLLGELALHWSPEEGLKLPSKVRSKILKIIKDPKLGGALEKYADKHAYATTALLRCLQRAREEGGVLAPASFVWLRGEDRTLWYPLHNLGRKSYHAEAVGAIVHYTNELIAGQKIPTPRFEEVIKNIQENISGIAGRPIPPLDRTPPPEPVKKKKFKIGPFSF